MTCSQLLLTLFLCYWLYSQFVEKKKLLSADIERGFRNSEEQVIDSLLAANIINPLINDSGNYSVLMIGSNDVDSLNQTMEMKLNLDSISKMRMHIPGKHDENHRVISKFEIKDTIAYSSDQDIHSTITVHAEQDTGNQLLFQGVKLLINAVGKLDRNQNDIYAFFSSNPDTTILTKIFARFIERNYSAFFVDWQSIDPSIFNKKDHSDLVFISYFFEDPYGVIVTRYNRYLLRSISPQIAFALILLMITGIAFRMAFINLKNQRKLFMLKNDFVSNITHELKTPVSTVRVALEALLDFNLRKDPKRTKEYLEMAHSEIDRLDLLVNQVLNNSALEDGNTFINTDTIDLVSFVREVADSMQSRFDMQNATVIINPRDVEIMVEADSLHLRGVIVNLLDNSLKYTEQIPEISIEISQDQKGTLLTISDNGMGIPDEYNDRIFDKFFRVPKGDRHNVKGYGLGLNYAALVMKHHKGKISVESNESGGCSFILNFPQPKPAVMNKQ